MLTLEVEKRGEAGAAQLRRAGSIPAVVYGAHQEATPIAVLATVFEKVFQEAGQALLDAGNTSIINVIDIAGKKIGDFDADLSITDVPAGTFGFDKNNMKNSHPWISEINKYSSITQTNECQRQGRCNLGCIPGARHTLNKRLFNVIHPQTGNPKPLEIKELCDVYDIEFELLANPHKVKEKER